MITYKKAILISAILLILSFGLFKWVYSADTYPVTADCINCMNSPETNSMVVSEYLLNKDNKRKKELTDYIVKYHKTDLKLAKRIVELAHKYQKDVFPRAENILAITAIESNFDPHAISHLKKDPAMGLMQIRLITWKNLINNNQYTIENQIKFGSEILSLLYKELNNKEAAIAAYNVGLTAYNKGIINQRYIESYRKQIEKFKINTA